MVSGTREEKGRNLAIETITSEPGFILCPWYNKVNKWSVQK